MKLLAALPLLGLSTAFVIPDDALVEQINRLPINRKGGKNTNAFQKLKGEIATEIKHGYDSAASVFDNTLDKVYTAGQAVKGVPNPWTGDWSSVQENIYELINVDHGHHEHDGPPDDGMPHRPGEPHGPEHGPDHPHHPDDPHHDHPHKPKHPKHPHHDPHHGHGKPNLTIYQMIQESKYTTKFAELVNEHEDIVGLLNSTENKYNLTVFCPTNEAFEKIPKHHEKPDAETLRRIILYHIVKDEYPAGRVLAVDTIPTALDEPELGGAGGRPQRLRISFGFRGVTLNFYSHLNAANIPATNGVIHGINAILVPPPPAIKVLEIMPAEFSTLELALLKTGLDKELAALPHHGLTLFAPDNRAWARLPHVINAFLFSERGLKYLKMLLEYHVVANQTLYSDAYYPFVEGMGEEGRKGKKRGKGKHHGMPHREPHHDMQPVHLDMETLLEGKCLSVDVANFYGFRNIRVNGYNDVHVRDGVARDGVLHVPGHVIVPPKKAGDDDDYMEVAGDESVEEFIERFDGLGEEKKQKSFGWWEEFEL